MSTRPSAARSSAETLPECEPPQHDVGAADQHRHGVRAARGGGFPRRRKLGDGHAEAGGFGDLIGGRVVVARQRQLARARRGDHRVAAAVAVAHAVVAALAREVVELRVGHAVLVLVVELELARVGELALAGRVVHHREQADQGASTSASKRSSVPG